jgi:hypothetical protein
MLFSVSALPPHPAVLVKLRGTIDSDVLIDALQQAGRIVPAKGARYVWDAREVEQLDLPPSDFELVLNRTRELAVQVQPGPSVLVTGDFLLRTIGQLMQRHLRRSGVLLEVTDSLSQAEQIAGLMSGTLGELPPSREVAMGA